MHLEVGLTFLILIRVTSGNFYPAPDRWHSPVINSKDGNYTLDETITEGESSNTTTLFTTIQINNVPTFYTVMYQTVTDMFYIDTSSLPQGLIYLNNSISVDYEQNNFIILTVEGGNPSGTGTLTLTINVVDVNDNSPVFESSLYRVRITSLDGITEGSYVTRVQAADNDTGTLSELTYAIQSGDQESLSSFARFSIDPQTGNITTTGHEFERSIYVLSITASDNGTAPRTGSTTLSVCINNIYCGMDEESNNAHKKMSDILVICMSSFFPLIFY